MLYFFHLDACVDCAVCQEKFSLDEEVRQLPCKHYYHFDCIEPWLKMVSIMSTYMNNIEGYFTDSKGKKSCCTPMHCLYRTIARRKVNSISEIARGCIKLHYSFL